MISVKRFDFYYIVFIPLGIYIEVIENVSLSSFCAFGDDNNSLESCEAKSRRVCAFIWENILVCGHHVQSSLCITIFVHLYYYCVFV